MARKCGPPSWVLHGLSDFESSSFFFSQMAGVTWVARTGGPRHVLSSGQFPRAFDFLDKRHDESLHHGDRAQRHVMPPAFDLVILRARNALGRVTARVWAYQRVCGAV